MQSPLGQLSVTSQICCCQLLLSCWSVVSFLQSCPCLLPSQQRTVGSIFQPLDLLHVCMYCTAHQPISDDCRPPLILGADCLVQGHLSSLLCLTVSYILFHSFVRGSSSNLRASCGNLQFYGWAAWPLDGVVTVLSFADSLVVAAVRATSRPGMGTPVLLVSGVSPPSYHTTYAVEASLGPGSDADWLQ